MLELKKFLNDFDNLKKSLLNRGVLEANLLKIRVMIIDRNSIIKEVNLIRSKRNLFHNESKKIIIPQELEEISSKKKELTILENKLRKIEEELNKNLLLIPNIPHSQEGKWLSEDKVVKVSEISIFCRQNLTLSAIFKHINWIDLSSAASLSGSRFVVYKDQGSQLLHCLINFMRAENYQRDYRLFDVPHILNEDNFYNTGQLPKFKDDLYSLYDQKKYLIPTAEVPLINIWKGQLIDEKELPFKICSYSKCFRLEAGAAGKENSGLIRLHEFNKVEGVIFSHPSDSYENLQRLVEDAENILKKLKLPYRIVELCPRELSFSSSKTYDLEVWLPISQRWLEISSCSNCEDFQSRRAMIRVKNNKKKFFPHILNGSLLAIDRLILAIIENFYDEESKKVFIPECLNKYLLKK